MSSILSSLSAPGGKTAMIAGSAAAALGALAYWSLSSKTSDSGSDLAPALTEEETRKLMSTILDKTKTSFMGLLRWAEGIKQQFAANGQEVDDATLMKKGALPQLESMIALITSQVLEENDVDEEEFEDAMTTYMQQGDDKLCELARQLRMIYKQCGGEVNLTSGSGTEGKSSSSSMNLKDTSSPNKTASNNSGTAASNSGTPSNQKKKFSTEQLLNLLVRLAEAVVQETDIFTGQFVEQYGVPKTDMMMEQFQAGIGQISTQVEQQLVEEEGLDSMTFQAIIMENMHNEQVVQIFGMMQALSSQVLQKHGISTESGMMGAI